MSDRAGGWGEWGKHGKGGEGGGGMLPFDRNTGLGFGINRHVFMNLLAYFFALHCIVYFIFLFVEGK